MRTSICNVFCILFFIITATAQNSPDCRSAIPICADVPLTNLSALDAGDIDDFDPELINQIGCLEKGGVSTNNIENNSSWFVFRAGTDGQLGFNIEALDSTAEWDFAVFGPNAECVDISSGDLEPIRCNYENNDTAFTGIGVNPENGQEGAPFLIQSKNTYDEWLDVRQGDVYFIFINEFNTIQDDNPSPYNLTFTGTSVETDQNSALDCTLRDEFLGLDIVTCEISPDIVLNAFRSPAGSDIANVDWSVDFDNDGIPDQVLTGTGPFDSELVVSSPNSGRYFVSVTDNLARTFSDDILINFVGIPVLDEVRILNDLTLSSDTSIRNDIEIIVDGNSTYEYAINGGPFQDDPIFRDTPPGINTVIINDTRGCGATEPIEFLVVGFPKFFTPNGDDIHDNWNILGIEDLANPQVFIFDRFGKLLIQLDEDNPGWDGTFNGRPLPSSDYWFRFEYDRNEEGMFIASVARRHFTLKR